ncbi:MAG: hypothetical protein R3F17_06550 [Planctomycetota bacterium]
MSKDRIRAESAGRTGVHWRSTLAVAPILLVALGHFVSRPVSTDEVVNGVHIQVTRYEALAGMRHFWPIAIGFCLTWWAIVFWWPERKAR